MWEKFISKETEPFVQVSSNEKKDDIIYNIDASSSKKVIRSVGEIILL